MPKILITVGPALRAEIRSHAPERQEAAWLRGLIVDALRRETGRDDITDDTPAPGGAKSRRPSRERLEMYDAVLVMWNNGYSLVECAEAAGLHGLKTARAALRYAGLTVEVRPLRMGWTTARLRTLALITLNVADKPTLRSELGKIAREWGLKRAEVESGYQQMLAEGGHDKFFAS